MPQTGAPRILKKISFLEGKWDVVMSVKSGPNADWIKTEGRSEFNWILDRTVLEQVYDGSMMGQPFKGRGYLAFNRFSGRWQHTWADNAAAILSMYEGEFAGGKLVVTGKEITPGSSFLVRITWYNISDDNFDWVLETAHSEDEWSPSMKAVYSRRQDHR